MAEKIFTVPSVFTGRFFKDNPTYGRLIVGFMFMVAFMIVMYVIGFPEMVVLAFFGVIIIALIVALIVTKGKISLNELDERLLTIGPHVIQVGEREFPVTSISKLAIYIHSYYNQRLESTLIGRNSSYGTDNRIYFVVDGEKHEYRFIIADESAFVALYWVLDDWNRSGFRYGFKEVYGRNYVQNMHRYKRESGWF
jgi:hypothetical protein